MYSVWLLLWTTFLALAQSHTVITYPGWRGNNLNTNDEFPYGMQRSYPCGGIPLSTNRTNWPVAGGAIAIQPGWFTGHAKSSININLGLGTDGPDGGPETMSMIMIPTFTIYGPSNNPFPGQFCLSQVPLPAGVKVNVGDHATIQVIETFDYGGALYNCVDITFSLPEDVAEVNESNCFNNSDISFRTPESEPTISASSDTTHSRAQLFPSSSVTSVTSAGPASTSCAPCPACPTATTCPNTNGNSLNREGLGLGLPLGAMALGLLGV